MNNIFWSSILMSIIILFFVAVYKAGVGKIVNYIVHMNKVPESKGMKVFLQLIVIIFFYAFNIHIQTSWYGRIIANIILFLLIEGIAYLLLVVMNWPIEYMNRQDKNLQVYLIIELIFPVFFMMINNEIGTEWGRMYFALVIIFEIIILSMIIKSSIEIVIKPRTFMGIQDKKYSSIDLMKALTVWVFLVIENLTMLTYFNTLFNAGEALVADKERITDFGSILYYVIITFTTVGYGDITPNTFDMKMIAVVISLVGMFYSVIFIGAIMNLLSSGSEDVSEEKKDNESVNKKFINNKHEELVKVRIRYKKKKFYVSIKDAIKIESIKGILLIKRIKRYIMRLFSYSEYVFINIVMWGIFIGVIYNIGVDTNVYNSLLDAIWEIKAGFFTSVIITWFVSIISKESNYRKNIREQYDYYITAMYNFEEIIYTATLFTGTEFNKLKNIFFTQERYDQFRIAWENEIDNLNLDFDPDPESYDEVISGYTNYLFDDTNYYLSIFEEMFLKNKVVGGHAEDTRKYIRNAKIKVRKLKREIENKNYDQSCIKKNIVELADDFYYIIADMRRVWRWDNENNLKIIDILNSNNPKQVEDAHYLNLFYNSQNEIHR